MTAAKDSDPRPVWSRSRVHTFNCPKSFITADSVTLLEEYWAWKRAGGVSYLALEARALEAFALLDSELRKEHSEQILRHQSTAGGSRHIRSFGE
jgi:hypothetical protein